MTAVQVVSNIKLKQFDMIHKHLNTPFGASLLAITILDKNNRNLTFDINFDIKYEADTLFNEILDVWEKYTPIKVYNRCYILNGIFMNTLRDKKMRKVHKQPTLYEEYTIDDIKYDRIIDIEEINNSDEHKYILYIYRWSELIPRKITIHYKDDIDMADFSQYDFEDVGSV